MQLMWSFGGVLVAMALLLLRHSTSYHLLSLHLLFHGVLMLSLHSAIVSTGNDYPWIGLLRLLEKLKRFTPNVWCQGCDLHREMCCCFKSPISKRQPLALTAQRDFFLLNICIASLFPIPSFVLISALFVISILYIYIYIYIYTTY